MRVSAGADVGIPGPFAACSRQGNYPNPTSTLEHSSHRFQTCRPGPQLQFHYQDHSTSLPMHDDPHRLCPLPLPPKSSFYCKLKPDLREFLASAPHRASSVGSVSRPLLPVGSGILITSITVVNSSSKGSSCEEPD